MRSYSVCSSLKSPNALCFLPPNFPKERFPIPRIAVVPRWTEQGVHVQALARQAPWCHLLHSGLAQSKPGWSAKACTRQAQSEIDGARERVWPEP